MAEPFLTTVVGSLPKPAWLLEQISMNSDGGKQVHGRGADWMLKGDSLKGAQDDAAAKSIRRASNTLWSSADIHHPA